MIFKAKDCRHNDRVTLHSKKDKLVEHGGN